MKITTRDFTRIIVEQFPKVIAELGLEERLTPSGINAVFERNPKRVPYILISQNADPDVFPCYHDEVEGEGTNFGIDILREIDPKKVTKAVNLYGKTVNEFIDSTISEDESVKGSVELTFHYSVHSLFQANLFSDIDTLFHLYDPKGAAQSAANAMMKFGLDKHYIEEMLK